MHFKTPYQNWNVDFLDSMSLSLQNNKVSTCRFSKSKVFMLQGLWKGTGFKNMNSKTLTYSVQCR